MRLLAVLRYYCCCGGGCSLSSDVTSGSESVDCLFGGRGVEDGILRTWVDEEISQRFFDDDGNI